MLSWQPALRETLGSPLQLSARGRNHTSVLFLSYSPRCRSPEGELHCLAFSSAQEIPAQGYFKVFQPTFPLPCSFLPRSFIPSNKKQASPEHLLNVRVGISLWEDVGMLLAEDVPNAAAGDDFQAPSAHPHTEGDLCKKSSFSSLSFCPRAGWILVLPLTSSSAMLKWGTSTARGLRCLTGSFQSSL